MKTNEIFDDVGRLFCKALHEYHEATSHDDKNGMHRMIYDPAPISCPTNAKDEHWKFLLHQSAKNF